MDKNTPPPEQIKPRGKPSSEGRFTWAASLALERIANGLGQTQAAYGVSVYISLCRLSSREKNNPEIKATVSQIAGAARLGYRKTFEMLHALAELRVISITESKRNPGEVTQPPNIYTLCSLRNGKPDRLPNRKPADCMRRTTLHAENPKDSPFRGESRKQSPLLSGSALGAQPAAGIDPWAEVAP